MTFLRSPTTSCAPPWSVPVGDRGRYEPGGQLLALPGSGHSSLLDAARERDITGGAVYDALVAATAKHAGATLLTRDRRAARSYEVVGATYELLG